ncbi:peptidase [Rathayibacter sp. YIM 133350]
MIDWGAFVVVFGAALLSSAIVVSAYSLGLRMLSVAGRAPVVEPAAYTDALTVVTAAEAKAAAKRVKKAKKAAKKNPLTENQKRWALAAAYACFTVSAAAVLYGIYLIIPAFHR